MNRRFIVLTPKGVKLPYTLDPSTLSDGAFPAGWEGASWTISSNKGVCTPTLGDELLTDGGLEANYTAGLCDSLTANGTPTLAQSADAHGGTKAQSFVADAGNEGIRFPVITPVAQTWYIGSAWGKRTAGAAGNAELYFYQAGGTPAAAQRGNPHDSAAYEQSKIIKRANSANDLGFFPVYNIQGASDTVIIDDCSLKSITQSTMIALRKAKADVTVKAKYTWDGNAIAGVVARANIQANPNTFLVAYYLKQSSLYTYCVLEKCVAGTWTNLITDWSNNPGAGVGFDPAATEWLEIRCSGTTVQLFHNNIQVGTDQTVNDVVSGVYAGVFQSGGSQLESFFVG